MYKEARIYTKKRNFLSAPKEFKKYGIQFENGEFVYYPQILYIYFSPRLRWDSPGYRSMKDWPRTDVIAKPLPSKRKLRKAKLKSEAKFQAQALSVEGETYYKRSVSKPDRQNTQSISPASKL